MKATVEKGQKLDYARSGISHDRMSISLRVILSARFGDREGFWIKIIVTS